MYDNSALPPLDARVRRSRDKLGDALIALIQEKPFDAITVQDVLDRAGVARSTFYAHFQSKEDLFLSDADEFFEHISLALVRAADPSSRLLPVREFLAHVAQEHTLVTALSENERLAPLLELGRAHFARGIERRLEQIGRTRTLTPRLRATLAQGLSGSFVALFLAWLRSPERVTPAELDELFHRLAWGGLGAADAR